MFYKLCFWCGILASRVHIFQNSLRSLGQITTKLLAWSNRNFSSWSFELLNQGIGGAGFFWRFWGRIHAMPNSYFWRFLGILRFPCRVAPALWSLPLSSLWLLFCECLILLWLYAFGDIWITQINLITIILIVFPNYVTFKKFQQWGSDVFM